MSNGTSLSGTNQPTEDEIIKALARALDAPEAVALSWLTTFARHFDPKAAQERLAQRQVPEAESPSADSGTHGLDSEVRREAAAYARRREGGAKP